MMSSPEERVSKWSAIKSEAGGTVAPEEDKELAQDFGLGRYMPLNPALGGERFVLPHSVAKSLFDRAGHQLDVNQNDSLMRYWKAREDANHTSADEQLTPEQAELVKAWHVANPAPPPPQMLTDGVPADTGAAVDGDDPVSKWKALSDGAAPGGADPAKGEQRAAKWKALKPTAKLAPATP